MRRRVSSCSALFVALAVLLAVPCRASSPQDGAASWSGLQGESERLIADARWEEAEGKLETLLAAVRTSGDEEAWTRALVRSAQVRMVRRGVPEALRFLKTETDPGGPAGAVSRSVLDLFVARSLAAYAQMNFGEISRRERIEPPEVAGYEHWTREQIGAAILAAYRAVWSRRGELGEVPAARWSANLESGAAGAASQGTLRDVVSFLYAGVLADRSWWPAGQSDEVYRLDLPGLIRGGEAASPHPLAEMAAVLSDLEAWHRAAGRPGAALVARSQRLLRLHDAFPNEEDRRRLREDLEASLAVVRELRALPEWSLGMATLAGFQAAEEAPGNLERAHATASAGAAAFPGSPGAARCLAIVRWIETPEYQLQGMASDGLGRRSIQVSHKNLPALYFRAYAIDLWTRKDRPGWQAWPFGRDEVKALLRDRPAAAWRTELPPAPDFSLHTTWVVPPIDRPGAYAVVASPHEGFDGGEQIESLSLLLGDLVLAAREREASGAVDVLALSGATGEPVAGAEVRLSLSLWGAPAESAPRVQTAVSDAGGSVRFAVGPEGVNASLLGRKGEDVAALDLSLAGSSAEDADPSSFLYTDRAVYRPQQKILWKVLAYSGRPREGRFAVAAGEAMTVTLYDPNGQKTVETAVTTNDRGTGSGEITIPPGRPLGDWRLVSRRAGQTAGEGSAWVRVEEYKRPAFEAFLDDPAEPLGLNRPARLRGRAVYYFGLPVTRGEVRWQVRRELVVPPGCFGCWRRSLRIDLSSAVVARGSVALSPEGAFEIAFNPRGDERLGTDLTYGFEISATITDEAGETREVTRRVRLGLASVEARIAGEPVFLRAGREASLAIVRSDLNGVPRPGNGAWTLSELRQPERTLLPAEQPWPADSTAGGYRTPGDALRPRWDPEVTPHAILASWSEGRRIAAGTLHHGAAGESAVPLPALRPGAYRLRYETRDDSGRRVTAQRDLIVAGRRTPLALPAVLAVEMPRVRVGETARLLVHSGLPGQLLFFEIDRDGEPVEQKTLRAGAAPSLIEIPIRAADRGGFGVRLLLVRDHQILDLSARVEVPWDDRKLDVRFATFRDKVRPGGHETWRVTVRGAGGEAVAAELLAAMTDRSLDELARLTPPDPLGLYPDRAQLSAGSASLGARYPSWVSGTWWTAARPGSALREDRLRFLDDLGLPGAKWARVQFGELRAAGEDRYEQLVVVTAESPLLDERRISTGATVRSGYYDFDSFGQSGRIPAARDPREVFSGPPGEAPRSDFRETALWQPHLLTGPDGSAAIELTVPDSVTSWSIWVHAVTPDLRAGSLHREARSAKDLLVRPALPRFLREGDRAVLKAVVTNAGTQPLTGEVVLDALDSDTETSLLADLGISPGSARQPFRVEAGGTASVTFPLTAPRRVGPVAFKVTAVAGDLSDGELRSLPILPARVHLAQSRSAMLRGAERRTLRFADLEKGGDPTRRNEQLVVTLDGQLFDGVLAALPYLVDDPYQCTEQTLNRFLSTGIVSSLFDQYPAVAKRAAELARRDTRLETWDAEDPNRKMALEETPFLEASRGGGTKDLVKVLDPRIARAERDAALARLAESQLPSGAFPWWPGGSASPYMTAYLLGGFARAAEFGISLSPMSPLSATLRDLVSKGWKYLAGFYRDAGGLDPACCVELATYVSYVATAYSDPSWLGDAFTADERQRLLDASFARWPALPRRMQLLLALALKRSGRPGDARLVFDNVMSRAETTDLEGTFWPPEGRAWLWSNDPIESQASALEALLELRPDDPRRHGLVQWLFLHKELNHWRSTRATAEVLYALVRYLKAEGQLGVPEAATVRVGGQTAHFDFAPDRDPGEASRVVIPGEAIEPARSAVVVEKETPGFLFAAATWHFSTEEPPRQGDGDLFHDLFRVTRRYFLRSGEGAETVLHPLAAETVLQPGDEVEVQLTVTSHLPAEYVHLRDPRPAGLEPGLALSGWRWDLGIAWYEETHDSATSFFVESLPAGEHTFKVRLRANVAGTFRAGPATVQSMYAPEFTAYSAGGVVQVGK
jgi:alpha-2-macroglobulin